MSQCIKLFHVIVYFVIVNSCCHLIIVGINVQFFKSFYSHFAILSFSLRKKKSMNNKTTAAVVISSLRISNNGNLRDL